MKIALFTGTAHRHIYFANAITANYNVVLHVRTPRSNQLTDEVDFSCSTSDKQLLLEHSNRRLEKEKEYFLPQAEKCLDVQYVVEVEEKEINGPKVITAVKESKPDTVLVYGTGLLRRELLEIMPFHTINLHAGLSPYYRGAATLYWPIYFMQPQAIGFTFHKIDPDIDSGNIIHQNRPQIFPDDEVHDLGCRTIVQASEDILKILKKIENGQIQYHPQKSKGKIFYSWDFKPYHLRVTNYLMKNGLIKEYLADKSYFPDPHITFQI